MNNKSVLTSHYKSLLIVTYLVLMAAVIFFMALSTAFQVGLLVASAVLLIGMLYSSEGDEPPCGAPIGHEGIARPRPRRARRNHSRRAFGF